MYNGILVSISRFAITKKCHHQFLWYFGEWFLLIEVRSLSIFITTFFCLIRSKIWLFFFYTDYSSKTCTVISMKLWLFVCSCYLLKVLLQVFKLSDCFHFGQNVILCHTSNHNQDSLLCQAWYLCPYLPHLFRFRPLQGYI